jgi:hypothetical protein
LTPAEAAEAILECILRVVIERGIEAMIRKARAAGNCWMKQATYALVRTFMFPIGPNSIGE